MMSTSHTISRFFITIAMLGVVFLSASPAKVQAATGCDDMDIHHTGISDISEGSTSEMTVKLDTINGALFEAGEYYIHVGAGPRLNNLEPVTLSSSQNSMTLTIHDPVSQIGSGGTAFTVAGGNRERWVYLYKNGSSLCYLDKYKIKESNPYCTMVGVASQTRNGQTCTDGSGSCLAKGTATTYSMSGIKLNNANYTGKINVAFYGSGYSHRNVQAVDVNNGSFTYTLPTTNEGAYTISLHLYPSESISLTGCAPKSISLSGACDAAACKNVPPTTVGQVNSQVESYKLCSQVDPTSEAYRECINCAGDETNPGGIWTAIGCIPRQPGKIAQAFISVGLGAGGGFGLVSTLVAGFLYSISAGDVKRTNQAKEMLTNSLIGLLFIIFSVTILQFIGYNILRIPGFGG